MRAGQVAAAALAAALGVTLASCAGGEEPEATIEDYCYAVHIVFFVTAESTDDGVVVGWSAQGNDLDPADYVVYRRPTGDETWSRLADVTIEAGADQTYLDTSPAEEAGTQYEYAVTRVDELCGGESDICPDGVCDVPPTALPLQPSQ